MKDSLAPILRCPGCLRDGSLVLSARRRDEREVRDGTLACASCRREFPVVDGVADLLADPPDFVARESAGLERFAAVMRADGWDRARILELPDVDLDYWRGQAGAMRALLQRASLEPGQRLLDVGSNTCWASNIFASRGLEVVALDICLCELQGLRTADYFIEEREVFFERVRSTMFAPALASASFDYVFCCEVLHHNDAAHLRRTLAEMFRVLRPGGRLLVINEPLRFPLRPKRDHAREVAQFEGNEHVYYLHQYLLAARRAGFSTTITALSQSEIHGNPLKAGVRLGRFAWRHLLRGDRALALDCVRPPEL